MQSKHHLQHFSVIELPADDHSTTTALPALFFSLAQTPRAASADHRFGLVWLEVDYTIAPTTRFSAGQINALRFTP